jgi:hypothetical protein
VAGRPESRSEAARSRRILNEGSGVDVSEHHDSTDKDNWLDG